MSAKVVARYLDGRVVKGTTLDADASKRHVHVRPPGQPPVVVDLGELKALFFVKSLDGDASHNEALTPQAADPRSVGTSLVSLTFSDGEVIIGMIIRFPPPRPFFFVVPVDTKSNNIRMLVNYVAVTSIKPVTAQEAADVYARREAIRFAVAERPPQAPPPENKHG